MYMQTINATQNMRENESIYLYLKIDIIEFLKTFLNITTELRFDCYIHYWFKYTLATGHIGAGILW